jgi:hypothetical protein
MMAKRLVLRVVPLLFPCCAGTRRGQAPRWRDAKQGLESATPMPFFC